MAGPVETSHFLFPNFKLVGLDSERWFRAERRVNNWGGVDDVTNSGGEDSLLFLRLVDSELLARIVVCHFPEA